MIRTGYASYAGGSEGTGGGAQALKHGGPVRPNRKQKRKGKRQGYAGGGTVDPMLMSVSLDSRAKNPTHYSEDREPLATRPAGAPEAPDEDGYAEGGEVQELPAIYVDPDEEPPPDEGEEVGPSRSGAVPGGTSDQPDQPSEPDQEPADDSQSGEAGRGGMVDRPQTGYQQPEQEPVPDEAPAPPDTGYGVQPPPEQKPLKEVLDYTRQQLGVGGEKPAEPAAAPPPPPADSTAVPVALPPPPGSTGSSPDEPAETPAPAPVPTPQTAPETPEKVPASPPAPAPKPQTPAASGPGNQQAIQDYVSGKRNFTPEQMTELLDRTNQGNPNLSQGQSILKAFKELVDKGDIDGASRFVQSMRPSYDSMRALMIAATAKGDFATAMQIASRMNNLIPSGEQVQFQQTADNQILATIRPDGGGPPSHFMLTPDQFARYANSPLSLFDHTAEQGLSKNMSLLTGQPPQGQPPMQLPQSPPETTGALENIADRVGGMMPARGGPATPAAIGIRGQAPQPPGPQFAQAAGPPGVKSDAPATGYNPYAGGKGDDAGLPAQPQGYATGQPRTGYNAVQPQPQPPASSDKPGPGMVPETKNITIYGGRGGPEVQTVPTGKYVPGAPVEQSRPQSALKDPSPSPVSGLNMGEFLGARQSAWKAFPGGDAKSRLERGKAEIKLIEGIRRDKAAERKETGLNERQNTKSADIASGILAKRDIAWENNVAKLMAGSQRALFNDLRTRRNTWVKNPMTAMKPFPMTPEDTAIVGNALQLALHNNIDFTQSQTPPVGGQPTRQPAAPAPAQTGAKPAQTPGTNAQPAQSAVPPPGSPERYTTTIPGDKSNPNYPPKGITLGPGETWLQGNQGSWRINKPAAKTQ